MFAPNDLSAAATAGLAAALIAGGIHYNVAAADKQAALANAIGLMPVPDDVVGVLSVPNPPLPCMAGSRV